MSLYVARLNDGNCITVLAENEQQARERASTLIFDDGVRIAGMRELRNFNAFFSLKNDGSLSLALWDCLTDNEILSQDYPFLNHVHAQEPDMSQAATGMVASQAAILLREAVRLERKRLQAAEMPHPAESAPNQATM